jgi:predicted ATPase
LVEEQTSARNYQAAIDYAHRYLAVDDLSEEMHRHLITLYAAIGDRSAATRQFEHCTVALERELGVSPLPETRTAYQAILEGQPSVPQPRAPSPVWATLPSLDVPLIGRDGALRRLETVYADVCVVQGKVVLISGEAGIGKSRLMQEFATRLTSEAIVVVGGGHEAEQDLPFWPLVEALRPHLPDLGRVMPNMAPAYLAELARLWPELRRLLADLPVQAHLEPDQERGRLFEALGSWLLGLAVQRSPLLLCLDDLHWVDGATLCWLGYLARQLTYAPLMVLGSYRVEEAKVVGALRAELLRLGCLQEVKLAGLSQLEVLSLIRHLSGQKSGAERFSQRLFQATGGNPFFLLETLRAMLESGILWQDKTGWSTGVDQTTEDYRELPLPDTVCEAIRVRLRRLSPQAHQVLEAGAVSGRHFSFDLAWAVSGRRRAEVVLALEELVTRQMIAESDGGCRFNHELVRRVVCGDLSHGRRLLLQRRLEKASKKFQVGGVCTLPPYIERSEVPKRVP